MNPKLLGIHLSTILILAFVLGCSGTGGNPVIPTDGNNPALTQWQTDVNRQLAGSQTHLWGFYEVSIDIDTLEVSVVPNRQMMFTANVVNFLNLKPASMTFHINGTPVGTDYIDVDIDVTLKHPFPGMPQYNGYDVRGIFMGDGSASLATGNVVYPVFGTDQYMFPGPDTGKGGPEGYTRWFNYSEFSMGGMPLLQYTQGNMASSGFAGTATLCPYKYFADGLEKDEDVWSFLEDHADQDGEFVSGASNTRRYYLRFPNAKGVKYGYAITANWNGPEAENHPSNAPETVACRLVDNSTVWYVGPTENGGDIDLDVDIWNWGSVLSNGVMEEYTVLLESTVLSSPYEADALTMTPIGGDENFSTYHVEVPADSVKGIENNEYWVIVRENGWDYGNDFGIPNQAEDDPLCAYFRFDLEVGDVSPECPTPKPSAITGSPQPNNGEHEATVTSTNLMGTTGLEVYLDMDGVIDGSYDIAGTDIQNVNVGAGTLDATFDLTGVPWGQYFVVLTNACGETGVSDEPLFTVIEYLVGDIYVSNHPDFDGEPEEGTMEHPFHTITAGIDASDVDDLILVDYGTGTYNERIYLYGGNHYITVRAYNWYSPSGRPLIDGPDTGSNYTIDLVHTHYITFQGFKITFGGAYPQGWTGMVEQVWTSNITFKDCYFTGDPPTDDCRLVQAMAAYWTQDCVITNCLFKDINAGVSTIETSIQLEAMAGGWNIDMEVSQNEFCELQTTTAVNNNLYVTAIDIVFDWGGILVRNNLVHHYEPEISGTPGYLYLRGIYCLWPLEYSSGSNGTGTIEYNTVDSISAEGAISYAYARGLENTNLSSFDANINVHSNIITNFTGPASGYVYGVYDDDITDYTCLWHCLQGTTEHPWENPAHEGVGCIFQDPAYVNNATEPYDYHLDSVSPAIGAGSGGEDMGCYGNLDSGDVVGLLGPED